jgi:glycogen(starch) synthase
VRPRTVLVTADTIGGVWSHTLELARALGAEGIEVVLGAMGRRPSSDQEREARAVQSLTLHAAPFRLPWMQDPWDDVARAGEWLLELAARTGSELAHLSEPVFGALPWPVPVIAVGHSCVLSWYAAVRRQNVGPEWDRYRSAMTSGLCAADIVVAPSRGMLASLRSHYGMRAGTVVRNGRDPARYAPGPKQPVVLTAGRLWDPAKNLGLLLEVAPDLPWPVHAAGDDRAPDGSPPLDAPAVRLLGNLSAEALAERFAGAAIYASPARYEPFGQSILEAALSGCALVLGDIPSMRELWDGVAVFVPPDEAATLRHALLELIRDTGLRETLAMRARRRALEYSPRRMARAYLELYGGLLAGPRKRGHPREVATCGS